ncbi:SapC family protein [Marinimicrobium alkaliphilum]|uniref:SapC family protein n=1 Tax=Marinimicrobium alkaliphilum TaxID=2202654 RepID=UPI000DBA206F|nr:SapC family protein [Marinimicrobium alkaliphilum]
MSEPVLLDSNTHKNTRVLGDARTVVGPVSRNCSVITQEFQRLASHFPVLLTKNEDTGQFACVALFGFDPGENLFVEKDRWQVGYVPLNIRRHPFMIGAQTTPAGEEEHVMLIDMQSERISEQDGEALFNDRGFPTPFTENMTSVLKTLKDGFVETQDFIQALLEQEMIVPANFEIQFRNGERREINGLYTISQDALDALTPEQVVAMHRSGHLQAAYMMIASLGQMEQLIERKNQRLGA